jgi:hypothetical protein
MPTVEVKNCRATNVPLFYYISAAKRSTAKLSGAGGAAEFVYVPAE